MSNARMAGEFCLAMAEKKFPDDAINMSRLVADWLTFAEIIDGGSHKHIPTERLNEQLELPQGAGVFGYRKFADKSYLLLTCNDGLAYWDGEAAVPELIR